MKFAIATSFASSFDAATRLEEIGNLSIQNATENAGRLSAMMGVRAAQTNPIEAHSIGTLNRSASAGDGQASALTAALSAMMMNTANRTPTA